MADGYRAFRASDQRALAQQVAAVLDEQPTQDRHAVLAAIVLTSDWLAEHEQLIRADERNKIAETIGTHKHHPARTARGMGDSPEGCSCGWNAWGGGGPGEDYTEHLAAVVNRC